jgi:hypothetical protein
MSGEKNFNRALIHYRLSAQVKKYRQKDPQPVEKMPEIGRDFRGGGASNLGVVEVAESDEQQSGYPRYDVQCVRAGKQIKKTARRIGGQVNTLNHKLAPNKDLSTEENETQSSGYRPPRAKCRSI